MYDSVQFSPCIDSHNYHLSQGTESCPIGIEELPQAYCSLCYSPPPCLLASTYLSLCSFVILRMVYECSQYVTFWDGLSS